MDRVFSNIIGDSYEEGNSRFEDVEIYVADPNDNCGLIEGITAYFDENKARLVEAEEKGEGGSGGGKHRIVFCEYFWNLSGRDGDLVRPTPPTCSEVGQIVSERMTFAGIILLHEIL